MGETLVAVYKNCESGFGSTNKILDTLNGSGELNKKLLNYSSVGSVDIENPMWFVHSDDELRLEGVDEFSLYIGRGMYQLESLVSWKAFLTSEMVWGKCRGVFYEFSKISGPPIYLPDSFDSLSYLFEGKSFDYLTRKLQVQYGPPSETIQSMFMNDSRGRSSRGYYIDYFEDM